MRTTSRRSTASTGHIESHARTRKTLGERIALREGSFGKGGERADVERVQREVGEERGEEWRRELANERLVVEETGWIEVVVLLEDAGKAERLSQGRKNRVFELGLAVQL